MLIAPITVGRGCYAYVLKVEDSDDVIVVDPGEAAPVIEHLERRGLTLSAILNTHHHYDHAGGNEDLLRRLKATNVRVFGHEGDKSRIYGLSDPLEDGAVIAIGSFWIRCLHTPGHTTGSMTYVADSAAFTGDTLLGGGTNRNFEGNADVLMRSVVDVIGSLPRDTKIYCGRELTEQNLRFAALAEPDNAAVVKRLDHVCARRVKGQPSIPSTLADELATNPFLRCDVPAVCQHVLGDLSPQPLYVFSRLLQLRERMRDGTPSKATPV